MSTIGQPERATQKRVIALFCEELDYRYLGDWTDRDGNSNIEAGLLTTYLTQSGYTPAQISSALHKLHTEADNHSRGLYGNNQAVYSLLRYGVPVKIEAGQVTETVHLINWQEPRRNDFAIAEEVTLRGNRERRPDIVLYVNGIAMGVLELKRSSVSLGDGIRQSLSNQRPEFNAWFFSTVQCIFAGNDSEGLQYGTIGTEEKYFLTWKEDEEDNRRFKLDKYLLKMGGKERLLELMHDFILFDGGIKKLPRVHQYFGIKAAQEHVRRRHSGIIWHTQGSGKSIIMVLLARWILEHNPQARVVIITDRDELDKQIERVFTAVGEAIYRTSSGRDLMRQLGQSSPRLSSERGNAMLVASSIDKACKYFTLFQKTPFKGTCALVTSYNPQAQDITREDTGANTETDKEFIYNTYTEVLQDVAARSGMTRTETYEEWAKDLFIQEPAHMRLLIVVDKLLTGFDAPPCTYLYIDKSMQDHGLFQAICRTNRLDGEDKDFGYIVDYKDLFKKVENAITVYTSELDHSTGGATPEVLLQDRLKKGRERLDQALETLALLCEPVQPPGGELEHMHYFCGNTEIATDLQEREPQRAALYKATALLVRAYATIADELEAAGYSQADITRLRQQLGALQGNKNAVAETIENNVRRTIIKEHLHDPAYYEKMSALLDEIITARK